jgi:hypothetical protein
VPNKMAVDGDPQPGYEERRQSTERADTPLVHPIDDMVDSNRHSLYAIAGCLCQVATLGRVLKQTSWIRVWVSALNLFPQDANEWQPAPARHITREDRHECEDQRR